MGRTNLTDCELQIGIFGTFDVENYGDLLFPLIAEAELSERLGPIQLHKFSYHSKTRNEWPYDVISLSKLPELINKLDGVIIGGGHIIRFDKHIAPNYFPPVPSIHHPTGYWLTPTLLALQAGVPVVWNTPGVHGEIPAWANPLIELALKESRYLSVRDESSRATLKRFADDSEIDLVPDSVFGIGKLLNLNEPSSEFMRLRDNLDLTKPYIIVQANKDIEGFARFINDHPQMYGNYRILVLQIGPIHGENVFETFNCDIKGTVRLSSWPHPLLLAELIGNASGVVGTSLHLSITALAFGVPVFRPADSFTGKHAVLSKWKEVFSFKDEDGIDPKLFVAERKTPSPDASVAIRHLNKHWNTIAEIFLNAGKTPAITSQAINSFWQALPGLLEARPPAEISLPSNFTERKIITLRRSLGRLRRRWVEGEA